MFAADYATTPVARTWLDFRHAARSKGEDEQGPRVENTARRPRTERRGAVIPAVRVSFFHHSFFATIASQRVSP